MPSTPLVDLDEHTITDEQIQDLRFEARAAGDDRQVEICNTALSPRSSSVARATARRVCARAISRARAQAT